MRCTQCVLVNESVGRDEAERTRESKESNDHETEYVRIFETLEVPGTVADGQVSHLKIYTRISHYQLKCSWAQFTAECVHDVPTQV